MTIESRHIYPSKITTGEKRTLPSPYCSHCSQLRHWDQASLSQVSVMWGSFAVEAAASGEGAIGISIRLQPWALEQGIEHKNTLALGRDS